MPRQTLRCDGAAHQAGESGWQCHLKTAHPPGARLADAVLGGEQLGAHREAGIDPNSELPRHRVP